MHKHTQVHMHTTSHMLNLECTPYTIDNGKCLGWRPGPKEPYRWITYSEVEKRALNLGAGLKKLGVDTGQDTYVGVYSQNNVDVSVL